MEVVVKPPPGDALYKLVAFLEENRLEFYVNISEPIKEAPTSSQASEDIDFSAAEIPKITSNESEISDKPTCKICHKKIQKANDYYRKKHVLHHLKFKTYNFKSEKSKKRIDEIKERCFPRDS